MKNSRFLTLAVFLGVGCAAAFADATDQNRIRIPQGRGLYLEVNSAAPPVSTALYVQDVYIGRGEQVSTVVQPVVAEPAGELRAVAVPNHHGGYNVLYERVGD